MARFSLRTFHLALSFSLLWLVAACSTPPTVSPELNQANLAQTVRQPFTTARGSSMSLSDFKGQIVLLHFFSPHCPVCTAEMPSLGKLHDSFKDSQFSVVGVVVSGVDPFTAQAHALQNDIRFPILLDTDGTLASFFSISEVPSSILLNRAGVPLQLQDPQSGEVTSIIRGARLWDTEKPVELIAQLVEGL